MPTIQAGILGSVYQIRCNLVHGSKETDSPDLRAVKTMVPFLKETVPALAKAILDEQTGRNWRRRAG